MQIIVVAQEDKDLEQHGRMLSNLAGRRYEVVADLDRQATTGYDRVTTYFIDSEGVVRQVFPQLIRHRAAWTAILAEIDDIMK